MDLFFLRYMNISDEWETPEKQPFKDFVSVTNMDTAFSNDKINKNTALLYSLYQFG